MKVFNINMWLLPFWLSKHNKRRLNSLVDYVKEKDPDIVTLQEVWMKKHLRFLKKKLSGYHFAHELGAGLVTLSKNKPLSSKFGPFKKSRKFNRAEKIATKGVLMTEFHANGRDMVLMNTHLYSPIRKRELSITKSQAQILKEMAKGLCIVCGDLNLHTDEFEKINTGFFIQAEDSTVTFSSKNPYMKSRVFDKVPDLKFDYILARIPNNVDLSYDSETVDEPLMSDHFGIFSDIVIR